jgi:hypothetical protein
MNQVARALAQSLSSPAIGTLPLWQRQSYFKALPGHVERSAAVAANECEPQRLEVETRLSNKKEGQCTWFLHFCLQKQLKAAECFQHGPCKKPCEAGFDQPLKIVKN